MTPSEILLDVTRLVSLAWTKRRSTGIDRVCEAYARHFAPRARAVVQHRGVVKVFSRRDSDTLFWLAFATWRRFSCKAVTLCTLGACPLSGKDHW